MSICTMKVIFYVSGKFVPQKSWFGVGGGGVTQEAQMPTPIEFYLVLKVLIK